jgi:hypothetical protein
MAPAARGLAEGAGEEGLAGTGGPGDQDHLVAADPVASGKAEHHGAVEAPRGAKVDGLHTRREPEAGLPEEPSEATILADGGLSFHEERKPVLEGEALDIRDSSLLLEGVGDAGESEFTETGEGLFQ